MTWDVAPCCSPGKAVLVGDVSPSLYFGSFVLLCVTALAVSLALHTHICALVAGFRVPCLDCGVLVVSGRGGGGGAGGGGLVLAWLLTPVVNGRGGTVVKETGSFLRAGGLQGHSRMMGSGSTPLQVSAAHWPGGSSPEDQG